MYSLVLLCYFLPKGNFGDRYFGTDAPSDWCESDEGMDYWGANRSGLWRVVAEALKHDTVKRATVIPHCSHLLIVLTGRWRCINHFLFRWVHRVRCRASAVAYLSNRFVPGRIPTILHSSFQWLITGVQVLPVLTQFHCKSQQTELHLLPALRQTLDYDVNNVASKVFILLQAAMLWKCLYSHTVNLLGEPWNCWVSYRILHGKSFCLHKPDVVNKS